MLRLVCVRFLVFGQGCAYPVLLGATEDRSMRSMVLITALVLVTSGAHAQRAAPTRDEELLTAILANFEEAYDAHDAARFVRDFASDADFMNAFGEYVKGRPAVQKFMDGFMSHQTPGFRRNLVDRRIQLLGPETAFVEETRDGIGIKNADGTDQPARRGHMMLVLRRQGDAWKIVHYRFTDIHIGPLIK